jgi:hypothetical protein
VAFVPESEVEKAIAIASNFPEAGGQMKAIGRVVDRAKSLVSLRGKIGLTRILSMLSGEQLPRIC